MDKRLGPAAFFVGFLLVLISSALWPVSNGEALNTAVTIIIAALGVLVGLLNITNKEVPSFLVAALAFTVSAGSLGAVFGQLPGLQAAASAFFQYVVTFTAPAAGVVAFKQIWMLAKD